MTNTASNTVLRFAKFSELDAWTPAQLFRSNNNALRFPVVALGELITQRKGFIILNDTQNYMRCRVQLRGRGVVLRDQVLGAAIKTKKQQVCRAGDFLVAEIDAKLGGFGIVPPDLHDAVVSSHYFLFEINATTLRREFLALCLRTQFFQKQVHATGSTNYAAIRPSHVLRYSIPLPPLEEQDRLIREDEIAAADAGRALKAGADSEAAAAKFLATSLGVQGEVMKGDLTPAKLHFVPFSKLERWGEIFQGGSEGQATANFPIVRLRDVVGDLQNGWSPKCLDRPAAAQEWGVLKLGAISFGEFDDSANKALPETLVPKPEFEVRQGDVLITRGNALSLVGAAAFVKATRPRLMIPDLVFRVVWPKTDLVDGPFLAAVLKMPFVRRQIEAVATGTSPSMKKVTKPSLLNLRFPLPPLSEQTKIMGRFEELREQARGFRKEAESRMNEITMSFERAVFGVPSPEATG